MSSTIKKDKILLLGSGALSIGQAGEFDYSGNQAIKAIVDLGYQVIVINPNIATVQTNPSKDVTVYLYPINLKWINKVIATEKPIGIMASFGGQTALNALIDLDRDGILNKYNISVLGSSVKTLKLSEDRELFREEVNSIGLNSAHSISIESIQELIDNATKINYPVIVRSAYSLGGSGSGRANNYSELYNIVNNNLTSHPQVLIEKSLYGWKEIEYEIMRDKHGNCICICNMENIDPVGIHTGESIVIAPSQTLNNREYFFLREISIKLANHFNIIGECNVQFAINPDTFEYCIIEMNARLSRSSALASKATGYPIAYIAAQVNLGCSLVELKNPLNNTTSAFFEPALDYIAIKVPKWNFEKFPNVSNQISSQMQSTGEVMAIGRSFEESFQKAIRMSHNNSLGVHSKSLKYLSSKNLNTYLQNPTSDFVFHIFEAIKRNYSIDSINNLTSIDPWFLNKFKSIVLYEDIIRNWHFDSRTKLISIKKMGFSDDQIEFLKKDQIKTTESSPACKVTTYRRQHNVYPYVKKIDSTGGEHRSSSNYLYLTYHASEHNTSVFDQETFIVLGAGPYNIGSSVEFDWSSVETASQLRINKIKCIMINCNPETVSTDFNVSDKLYFEELGAESIFDISHIEKTNQVIACVGGQIPNNLIAPLENMGLKVIGHNKKVISTLEDRLTFSKLLDTSKIKQPKSQEFENTLTTKDLEINFPIIARPSFVLSGSSMKVLYSKEEMTSFLNENKHNSKLKYTLSEFIEGAKEIEVDGVANSGEVDCLFISEHIEKAGTHSGDAMIVFPSFSLDDETKLLIEEITSTICKKSEAHGPFNIQMIINGINIYVIEFNARASRTFPLISKATNINLIERSINVFLNKKNKEFKTKLINSGNKYYFVKSPMFSFNRLKNSDPVLSVDMKSTGEVACISKNLNESILLSLESVGIFQPQNAILMSINNELALKTLAPKLRILQNKYGIKLFTCKDDKEFYKKHDIQISSLNLKSDCQKENINSLMKNQIEFFIDIPSNLNNKYIRQQCTKINIHTLTNLDKTFAFLNSIIEIDHNYSLPISLNSIN